MKNRICFFLLIIVSINLSYSQGKTSTDTIGTFSDSRDGHVYKWIKIGTQIWMAENLAYLPVVSPSSEESENEPYYYVKGYEGTSVSEAEASANYTTYGVLYNWSAAMAGEASSNRNPSGVQGVCPSGWHLPSHREWIKLIYLCTELTNVLGAQQAGVLKESGMAHWQSPNAGATNESGFTALPGGYRSSDTDIFDLSFLTSDGNFFGLGFYGAWWSASQCGAARAWGRRISFDDRDVTSFYTAKEDGFSVRCRRDN